MKTISFISISFLAAHLCCCTPTASLTATRPEVLYSLEHTGRYRVHIKGRKIETTAILVVKRAGEEWRGSMVNEFGVKVFDFRIRNKKCKLQTTLPQLNKWYIRKTLESDFACLFRAARQGELIKGKTITLHPNGSFTLHNERREIAYTFVPLDR